jgi:hypothetical protein
VPRRTDLARLIEEINALAQHGPAITVEDVRRLLTKVRELAQTRMIEEGYDADQVKKLSAKFRDAGRRSAPWRPVSSLVPGRPQTGADGNRISRWLLPQDHKFYADEVTATLVEIKFFLQALSFNGAPSIDDAEFQTAFTPWLVENPVLPDTYVEPIQLVPIELAPILADRRRITSGHIIPLDREGGTHVPKNVFLVYGRSNQLQGNMTLDELLTLAERLVDEHKRRGTFPSVPIMPPESLIKSSSAVLES